MKGLLVKDFKLMKGQKNFFILIVAIAVGMAVLTEDPASMIGFLSFVLSLFTLSTISYDEFDNGNAFLFTLPVSRRGYAVEKYGLSLLLGGGAWIFSTILAMIVGITKETASVSEIGMTALMILPVVIVIQAVMIPFQLKFGGEKGRIALIGAFGLLFVIGIGIVKAAQMLGIDIRGVMDTPPMVSLGAAAVGLTVVAAILLLASVRISISIMEKKEF